MNDKIGLKTTEKIFRLRNFLQQISHISFTFSKINQNYPLDTLTEKKGQELLTVYQNLLKDADSLIKVFKEENDKTL